MKRIYNIKDIARACGVGVSTVSRVINDHPDVSEQTKKKVLEAVDKYHYIPNNSARNLVSPNSNSVGIIAKGKTNPFYSQMITTMEEVINEAGYLITLQQIDHSDDEIKSGALLATEKNLQGIIFLGGNYNHTDEEIKCLHVPFVFTTFTNEFGTLENSMYSSVAIDDEKEGYRATSYALEMGHKNVAIIMASKEDKSASDLRFRGYKRALLEHGTKFEENLTEITGDFSLKNAYEATNKLLDKKIDISCIFAISDMMAIAACKAAIDRSLKVPEDISVIGIDGIEISKYTNPTITTLKQPAEEMARESASILLGLIKGACKNKHHIFEAELRAGQSFIPSK